MDRTSLRATLIQRRAALSSESQQAAARHIAVNARRLPHFGKARTIACYFAVRGEVDCSEIIHAAWQSGRKVYLPVLCGQSLRFAAYTPRTSLSDNRYGIPEPVHGNRDLIDPRKLDVVFCPLVAFDTSGTRIGMGGGYYDRSLNFLACTGQWRRPALVGLAYEFQKITQVESESWDVPLKMAVTECCVYSF